MEIPELHINEVKNTLDIIKGLTEAHHNKMIEIARKDIIDYGIEAITVNPATCPDDEVKAVYLEANEGLDVDRERFIRYEKIRVAGEFNMLTQEAWKATGLSLFAYSYVLHNYSRLVDKYHEDAERIHKEFINMSE